MLRSLFAIALAVVILASLDSASEHMRITPCAKGGDFRDCALITISGEITTGDGDEFLLRTKDIKNGGVAFLSAGGSLTSGLMIGERIHDKGFRTVVLAGDTCASSCAFAWLAGKPHEADPGSTIMFHAPYRKDDPNNSDGAAAILLGMYLARIGIDYDVATKYFGHDPNEVAVLRTDSAGLMTLALERTGKGAESYAPDMERAAFAALLSDHPHIADVDLNDTLSNYLGKMWAIGLSTCMDIYPRDQDLQSRCAGSFVNVAQKDKRWKIH